MSSLAGEAFPAKVVSVRAEARDVLSFRLQDPAGGLLPAWQPGAHIDVTLPSGLVRQYSLCGDMHDCSSYRIAVLREAAGRGGSAEAHERQLCGTTLMLRGPRNHFPLVEAPDYLFLAGGIGITPILSMVRAAAESGRKWRLIYAARSRDRLAFVDELAVLGHGELSLFVEDESGRPPFAALLSSVPPGTEVYACGPEGMLAAVTAAAGDLAADRLHLERFGASPEAPAAVAADTAGFQVELRRSGRVLQIPADRTILAVVREEIPDVAFSCEEGFCGACEARVLEGIPEHRDEVLTPAERAANKTMMICVGRSKSDRLVLDL